MEGDKDYPAEHGVPVALKRVPDFTSDCSSGLARTCSLDAPRSRKVSDDQRAFNALVQCQECYLPKILTELDKGGKESCWAWYIFPTEKAGFSDFDETRVTSENAVDLCCHESTAEDWRRCLEKICDLLEVPWLRLATLAIAP
eukprot:Skav203496  [mRNA]  locus=scaffold2089:44016:44773:- [translate_table: standard]